MEPRGLWFDSTAFRDIVRMQGSGTSQYMNTELSIKLPDGRTLAFAEYGDPRGHPVLYFHGSPGSRLEPLLFGDEALAEFGLRVIAPDRPGMGKSDFQVGRGFSHWPTDVAALADHLHLERFSVMGNSGGAGYAAACAAKIPERVHAAAVCSGGWPMHWPEARQGLALPNRVFLILSRHAPFLLPRMLKMMAGSPTDTQEQILAQFKKHMPAVDYTAIAKPGRAVDLMRTTREAMARGTQGAVWDMRLHVRRWDFELEEVHMPIALFHGAQDRCAPIALAHKAKGLMRSARLVTYADESHLSTPCNHLPEIARALRERV
jgi:pimeloyl-ACP methyl ester carboxylesterase